MNVIICVDENGGVMFNNRRQSRDEGLVKKLLSHIGDKKLWIGKYSIPLFESYNVTVSESFLDDAKSGEYCFVEGRSLAAFQDKIEGAIVFNWMRAYPSDRKSDLDLSNMKLVSEEEFKGSSHPEIKMQVYKK